MGSSGFPVGGKPTNPGGGSVGINSRAVPTGVRAPLLLPSLPQESRVRRHNRRQAGGPPASQAGPPQGQTAGDAAPRPATQIGQIRVDPLKTQKSDKMNARWSGIPSSVTL